VGASLISEDQWVSDLIDGRPEMSRSRFAWVKSNCYTRQYANDSRPGQAQPVLYHQITACLLAWASSPTIPDMPVKPEQLHIVHYPHPVLREVAKPIKSVSDEVRGVARRMLELMQEARGVGLAAPQVGLPWRMFVANPTGEPGDDRIFINPKLSDPSAQTHPHEEGCLSLPHITGEITRPTQITINALDEQCNPFQLTSDELAARVWQHENDHLDGILILDRMPAIDKVANRQAVQELEDAARG